MKIIPFKKYQLRLVKTLGKTTCFVTCAFEMFKLGSQPAYLRADIFFDRLDKVVDIFYHNKR